MILHMQLPHSRVEALRNGVSICRDVLPALGRVSEMLMVSLGWTAGTSRWYWGHVQSHRVSHTPGSGG